MKRIRCFLTLYLYLVCIGSLAAQGDTLRLANSDYRERVLDYSHELKQAEEGVVQAQRGVEAVRSGMLPQVSAEASFSQLMEAITLEIADFSVALKPYSYGVTVTALQNIYSGGAIRKKGVVAEKNVEIAKSLRLMTIDNIKYSADYAYWSMAAIRAYKDISERYLTIVRETLVLVRERYESGLISKNDLLLIQTRVSEAELNYSFMQSRYKAAVIGVNVMMGMPPSTPFLLIDNVIVDNPQLPSYVDIVDVLHNRSEYLIANYKFLQSEDNLLVTKSDYLPRLSVGVAGQYETALLNFDGSADLDAVVFARLSVPIFSGGAKRHRVAIDYSRVRSLEHEMGKVRDDITSDVATSWSNLTECFSQLTISSRNYDSAIESLELSTYSFSQGLLSILDLMQAQLSWLGAINGIVEANYNFHLALAGYRKAVG